MLVYKEIGKALSKAVSSSYAKADKLKFNDFINEQDEMLQHFKAECFTVAGVLHLEVEEKLKAIVTQLISEGSTNLHEEFLAKSYPILSNYIPLPKMPPPSYLQTNLQTAISSSYNAQQYMKLQEHKKEYPAYKYMTRNDGHVREAHSYLHGKVFSCDDEVWNKIMPPNGWNCRCYITPISENEYSEKLKEEANTNGEERSIILDHAKIDADFSRNSGQIESIWQKWLENKLKGGVVKDINERLKLLIKDNKNTVVNSSGDEVWAELDVISDDVKFKLNIIVIKISGNAIEVKLANGKVIKDDISNIDKYRVGVPIIE